MGNAVFLDVDLHNASLCYTEVTVVIWSSHTK